MKHEVTRFAPGKPDCLLSEKPLVLIRLSDHTYVSAARYERQSNVSLFLKERRDVLICSPSGDGYLQAQTIRDLDYVKNTNHFQYALKAAHMARSQLNELAHRVPPVLSQIEPDLFVPGIPGKIALENIFVERTTHSRPHGFGNLLALGAYLQFRFNEVLTEDQIKTLDQWKAYFDDQPKRGVTQDRNRY